MADEGSEKVDKEAGEKLVHEGWTDFKEKKRHTTDVLLLLLLVACWVCMTAVGLVVTGAISGSNDLKKGTPALLLNPMDYAGRICGHTEGVEDRPMGYFMYDLSAVCVKECPTENDATKFICKDEVQAAADASLSMGYQMVGMSTCMYKVKSSNYMNKCVATAEDAAVVAGLANVANGSTKFPVYNSLGDSNWFNDLFKDIYANQGVIFGLGLGFANVVAFLYLYILRIPGCLTMSIWGVLWSIQIVLLVGSALLYMKYVEWEADKGAHSENEILLIQIGAYFMMFFTVCFALLMCVMRKRIALAIAVVKEAARSIASMPMMIFMPVVQCVGLIVFLAPWMVYCVYLASSGDPTILTSEYTNPITGTKSTMSMVQFEYNTNTKYAFLYMLFSYFWTSQFIVAFGQLTIALAICAWYFNHDKSTVGNGTLVWAAKTTLRYHSGTAAYGSLIIAMIKTIRAILMYIQNQARKSKNKILEIIVCCIGCCLWCVEKCVKFLNKNAYIQTALYGSSFCKSARKAFFLIARNILRVAAVNSVGHFVLLLGRLFIPTLTTFVAYLALGYQTGNTNGLILPLIFVWLLAYFIGCMYSEIFGMSIETILNCYIADEEMFPPELRYAEGSLRQTMADTQKAGASAVVAPESSGKSADDAVVAKPVEETEEALL